MSVHAVGEAPHPKLARVDATLLPTAVLPVRKRTGVDDVDISGSAFRFVRPELRRPKACPESASCGRCRRRHKRKPSLSRKKLVMSPGREVVPGHDKTHGPSKVPSSPLLRAGALRPKLGRWCGRWVPAWLWRSEPRAASRPQQQHHQHQWRWRGRSTNRRLRHRRRGPGRAGAARALFPSQTRLPRPRPVHPQQGRR